MARPWELDIHNATIEWRILSPALRGRYGLPIQMMPSLHGDEDERNAKRKAARAAKGKPSAADIAEDKEEADEVAFRL